MFGITAIEDGDQAPLTYEKFVESEVKPSFPANPREFTIIPLKGVVEAHSSLKLKVNSKMSLNIQLASASES